MNRLGNTLSISLAALLAIAGRGAQARTVLDNFGEYETTSLPFALRKALLQSGLVASVNGSLPDTIHLGWLDLNADGSPEYFVSTNLGGTGGAYFVVFQRQKRGYVRIAELQGDLWFGSRKNGYLTLHSIARRGAGLYEYYTLTYYKGAYHEHSVAKEEHVYSEESKAR